MEKNKKWNLRSLINKGLEIPRVYFIYKEKEMSNIKSIFSRATIRGVADYLLFGNGPDEDDRSYEERMEEIYLRFEKAVAKYDPNPTSELLDLCNELTSETASVYMEIGVQAGVLLMQDLAKNMGRDEEKK